MCFYYNFLMMCTHIRCVCIAGVLVERGVRALDEDAVPGREHAAQAHADLHDLRLLREEAAEPARGRRCLQATQIGKATDPVF